MDTLLPCLSHRLTPRGIQSHRTEAAYLPGAIFSNIQGRKTFALKQMSIIMKYVLESLR